ncbi:MAG TPA: hypothetical protein VGO21_04430 [Candidatus Paceibacterota bacterium]|jgi:hypothetical protein|nr:hypothetical protein [Candidatus Paceibacterota bacterium]
MSILKINGKDVHVDDNDFSAQHAAKYLEKNSDNARNFFDAAHHDHTTNSAHFEIPHAAGYNGSHHFTVIHNTNDGTYTLRRRTGY